MTNTKTKTAIILAITLIIGMVIGFFINSMLVRSRFEKFTKMRKPGGMEEMMLEYLNPTEQQRPVVKDILMKFKIKMDKLREKSFEDFYNVRDSLVIELKPVLTEEQLKRMNDRFFYPNRRFRPSGNDRWQHGEGNPPPPPAMDELSPDMKDSHDRSLPPDGESSHEDPTPPSPDKH